MPVVFVDLEEENFCLVNVTLWITVKDGPIIVLLWGTSRLFLGVCIWTLENTSVVLEFLEEDNIRNCDVLSCSIGDEDQVIDPLLKTGALLVEMLTSKETSVILKMSEDEMTCVENVLFWARGENDAIVLLRGTALLFL